MKRTCRKCGESKPATAKHFVAARTCIGGIGHICWVCQRAKQHAYYLAKVRKTRGCWIWIGSKDKDGYGKFQVSIPGENRQRYVRAHAFAFELVHGRSPNPQALHDCDNRLCVRVSNGHVKEGTQSENIRDCVRRGRHARIAPMGEQQGNAILTDIAVRKMRADYSSRKAETARSAIRRIAKANGVAYPTAAAAIFRKTWRHI
jgi:hypothetical protein